MMSDELRAALDALGVVVAPKPKKRKPAPSGPIRLVRKGEEPDF